MNPPTLVCYDDDDDDAAIIGTIGSYFYLNALLDTEYHRTDTLWFSGEKRSVYVARERERKRGSGPPREGGRDGDETTRT